MHVDIAVGTVLGTLATANALAVVDDDFQRRLVFVLARLPVDGVDRAANQAVRIEARTAGTSHEEPVEAQPLADQPGDAAMRVRAGLRAFVAPSASFQIEHQKPLRVEETLIEKLPQRTVKLLTRRLVAAISPLA